MKKVIKAFKKLNTRVQNELYLDYSEGELERTVFPYNGDLEEGVLFKTDDCIYLVPISSILEMKSSYKEKLEEGEEDGESVEFDDDEISDEE